MISTSSLLGASSLMHGSNRLALDTLNSVQIERIRAIGSQERNCKNNMKIYEVRNECNFIKLMFHTCSHQH